MKTEELLQKNNIMLTIKKKNAAMGNIYQIPFTITSAMLYTCHDSYSHCAKRAISILPYNEIKEEAENQRGLQKRICNTSALTPESLWCSWVMLTFKKRAMNSLKN